MNLSHPRSTSKKGLIGTWISIAVVVGSFIWEYHSINVMPTAVIPTPKMPVPNAFDDYLAASSAILNSEKIGFAMSTRHAASPAPTDDRDYTLAEKEALVRENTMPLKKLRASLREPYWNPPIRSYRTTMPYYAKFRAMARLLALEGQVQAAHNQYGAAVNSNLDAIHMGMEIPHGSPLLGELVGIACQAIGRKPIWDELDHLNANEARAAVWRLEKIQSHHISSADTLVEEKWLGQAGMLELFRKPNWPHAFVALAGDDKGQNLMLEWEIYFTSKRETFDNYTRYTDQAIRNARYSYASHPKEPAMPDDVINQILVPVYSKVVFKDVSNSQTQNALLLTSLALHAYQQDNGFYPDTLQALAPTYLAKVPDDPFALSGPLKYIRTGARYILYSVGPDGVDDSGKPVFDSSIPKPKTANEYDRRYSVKQDSKGDIVAGINKI